MENIELFHYRTWTVNVDLGRVQKGFWTGIRRSHLQGITLHKRCFHLAIL